MVSYFFDTYALYEVIEGNPSYRVFEEVGMLLTKLNLMELYYGLLNSYNKEIADKYYDFYSDFAVEIKDEEIKEAMVFKATNKKRNLSYADCIGYIIAKNRCVKFLTGDKEFESLPNVEFVK